MKHFTGTCKLQRFLNVELGVCNMVSVDVSRLFGVTGRVALVTGGSSGIGFMIAQV